MKHKEHLPKIVVITPTLNNEKLIPSFIRSIKRQNYPKNKIELIFVDGGSKDATKLLAKKNRIRIIPNPHILAEPAIDIGMTQTTGDIKMILAADNIYKDKNAFKKIAEVFRNKKIFAAFPRHESTESDNFFTKYHNRFTDPFNHFLYGDAANARTFKRIYRTLEQTKEYDIYDYRSADVRPIIALAQGFAVKGNFKRKKHQAFDDIKPIIDLIEENKSIAYLHNLPIYHHTTQNLSHFLRKQRWATQNVLDRKKYGIAYRKNALTRGQKMKIVLWPAYAFSIIIPTIHAVYGLVKDREVLWIYHPLLCFLSAYASMTQVISYNIRKVTTISRQ